MLNRTRYMNNYSFLAAIFNFSRHFENKAKIWGGRQAYFVEVTSVSSSSFRLFPNIKNSYIQWQYKQNAKRKYK